MKTDETKLVDRICQGELEAFHELVEIYKKKVYYLAFDMTGDHHDAEDISQEVFIKVFRHIKKFRKDAALKSWIYQITVNTCIDAQRKKSKKPQVLMEAADMDSLHQESAWAGNLHSDPERHAEANIIQHRVQQMLLKISPKERSAFVMRYYDELKTSEIAVILEVSTNTIKSFLFRARKKLQKELSFYQGNPQMEVSNESM
jgi:RNA polymerase sigma-70 factor (ECF subfamily)